MIMSCPDSTPAQISFRKGEHQCGASTAKEKVFLDAVRNGDSALAQQLLQKGADPNVTDDCGIPVITYGAALARPDLMKLLISSGADVNSIDSFHRRPPLLWVIDSLFEENEENGEDVCAVVKLLISAGAKVNLKGESDEPALTSAVLKGNDRLLELLISAGADINYKDGEGLTAYSYAARLGNQKLKRALIDAGADPQIGVREYREEYGEAAFFQAAADGRTDVIEAMLANGTDVNGINKSKVTALMRAVEDSTVDALLKAGADVNMKDDAGLTALTWAALFRRTSLLKKLIAAGADVNVQTRDGKTVLDLVTDPEVRAVLVRAGARSN
jgi:ankyrin repeat protein